MAKEMTPDELLRYYAELPPEQRQLVSDVVVMLLLDEDTCRWVQDQLRFMQARLVQSTVTSME